MTLQRASTGAIVNIGQVIGRGGEGTVHTVNGAPKLVAKIYLKPPDATKAEKLRIMIRGLTPGLLGVAAWPIDLLTDERGAVCGFLMNRIFARQDAHRLYTPKSRRGNFPDADFRFVVRAATNLARAFAQIHVAGHVIGDVNHGNALIGKDGTAVLIDCDSIQVRERQRNRLFSCDVGTPLFTPPELQRMGFRGLRRTEASDRFGLAVLVFHLLFQGRHPFAGVYAGGEMPLERAIAESRFAYGSNAASLGMSQPPGTLALTTFGRPIARLFERAFAPPGGEEERPSAIEWIEALQALESELTVCPRQPRHFHPQGTHCCWCAIETLTGARLFGEGQASTPDADAVTAEELWKVIEGVKPPKELDLPAIDWQPGDSITGGISWGERIGWFVQKFLPVLAVGAVLTEILGKSTALFFVCMGTALLIGDKVVGSGHGRADRPSRLRRALRIEWESALTQWRMHSSGALFASARMQLQKSRSLMRELVEQQRKELDRLTGLLERPQRDAFLDSFEIDKAVFLAVTQSHIEMLASRGIRTAGDIRRKRGSMSDIIPDAAEAELLTWMEQSLNRFKFDVRDPTYVADAAQIDEKYRKQRLAIIEDLRRGPALLAAKSDEIADARARAEDVLRRKAEELRRQRGKLSE